jgi:ABC-2 type transport system permease protein
MEKTRLATTEETVLKGAGVREEQPREVSTQQERTFRAVPKMNKGHLHGLWALTNRDLRKWYKNPILLFTSLIQPIVWLGLFGKAFNFGGFVSGAGATQEQQDAIMLNVFGTTSYFSFLACGMLAFVILFTCAFGGMSVVFDRRFGFLNKALSTPVGRGAIVMAKVLQTVLRAVILAGIVLAIGVVFGMDTSHFTLVGLMGTFSAMFLMAFGLSSLFVMLALRSSDWQTQMAIINLLNLPLLFASNAMFPAKEMPQWLQYIVRVNPVSYANDAVRQLLLGSAGLSSLPADFAVLLVFAGLFATSGIILSWRLLSK